MLQTCYPDVQDEQATSAQLAQSRSHPKQPPTVAVVGLGKIGLPLAVQYALHGQRVIGCDINPAIVEAVNNGKSPHQEEPELLVEVPRLVQEGLLVATTDTTAAVRQAAVVVIIVPVFVDDMHQVDLRSMEAATRSVGSGLKSGTLVIYETTLPVGTTAQRLRVLLETASGRTAGRDFSLAYSPERVSSGSIFRDLRIYPKIVGGIDQASTQAAVAFYRSVLDAEIMTMASTDEAEFVKLIETTYRDVNIALANEFAQYADTHGFDVTATIAAANTQPYSHIHAPGVGVGGHCIPVYPYFLLNNPLDRPKQEGLQLPRQSRLINDGMAEYAVQRIESIIGSCAGQSVLILGAAYRGNVRETAFSSARLIQEALQDHGANVYVDDPLFTASELRELGYTPLPAGQEQEIRAIVLQSNHQSYQAINISTFPNCQLLLDGRRAFTKEKIESLGIRYIAIGDGQLQ